MAIDKNGLSELQVKSGVVQTPVNESTEATAAKETSQKPIEMKTQADKAEEAQKNSEVIRYLNSDEFKNLSEEEKIKAFRQMFCPGMSEEEAKNLYNTSKRVAAEFAQQAAVEAGANGGAAAAVVSQGAEAEVQAKKDIIETLKNELNIENPTEADIYSYLTELKKSGAELTPEQAKMLKTYNQLADMGLKELNEATRATKTEGATGNVSEPTAKDQRPEPLFTQEQILNSNFINLNGQQRLELAMGAYLSKHDPKYAAMTDDEKAQAKSDAIKSMSQQLTGSADTEITDEVAMGMCGLILDLHENPQEGKSIQNLQGTPAELQQRSELVVNKMVKGILGQIFTDENFKGKSAEEKLMMIGTALYCHDSDFVNSSDADKKDIIFAKMEDLFGDIGIPVSLRGNKKSEERGYILDLVSTVVEEYAKDPSRTLSDLKQTFSSPAQQATLLRRAAVASEKAGNHARADFYKNKAREKEQDAELCKILKIEAKDLNNEIRLANLGTLKKSPKGAKSLKEMSQITFHNKCIDASIKNLSQKERELSNYSNERLQDENIIKQGDSLAVAAKSSDDESGIISDFIDNTFKSANIKDGKPVTTSQAKEVYDNFLVLVSSGLPITEEQMDKIIDFANRCPQDYKDLIMHDIPRLALIETAYTATVQEESEKARQAGVEVGAAEGSLVLSCTNTIQETVQNAIPALNVLGKTGQDVNSLVVDMWTDGPNCMKQVLADKSDFDNIRHGSALYASQDKDKAAEVKSFLQSSKIVSDFGKSTFTGETIELARKTNPDKAIDIANTLTSDGDAPFLEGATTQSQYFEGKYKAEYDNMLQNNINNALKNGTITNDDYNRINHAWSTGHLSDATLATRPSGTSGSGSSSSTGSTSSTSTGSSSGNSSASGTSSLAGLASAGNVPKDGSGTLGGSTGTSGNTGNTSGLISLSAGAPVGGSVGSSAPSQAGVGSQGFTISDIPTYTPKVGSTSGYSTSSVSASSSSSSSSKAEAMDNAQSVKSSIDQSIKEWEANHNSTLSHDEITALKGGVSAKVVEEILNNPEMTNEQTSFIKKLVSNASSVNDLFDKLVSFYGTEIQSKFIDVLSSNGSSTQVAAFAKGSNDGVIKNLYLKCNTSTLKSELLNMLPANTIAEMLREGKIADLSMVDYKFIVDHVMNNMEHMSNSEFNMYMKYLPLDERQKVCGMRMKLNPSTASSDSRISNLAKEDDSFKSRVESPITSPQSRIPASASNAATKQTAFEEGDTFSDPFRSETETLISDNGVGSDVVKGSDEWLEQIRNNQTSAKVSPSTVHDSQLSKDDDFWAIGGSGSNKVPFGRDYDKFNHRGHVYWG